MRLLLFSYCFFCYCSIVYGQQNQLVSPSWIHTFGDHLFTGRDELADLKRDGEGNIFGFLRTERDSTASDVALLKLNAAGILQWEYRFSSGLNNDYDLPLFMEFADQGGLYFGTTNDITISSPFRQARIGKVDKQGQLEWVRDLNQVLPAHETFGHIFAFTDALANLHVTYQMEQWRPTSTLKTTHFLVFNPSGELIENLKVPEIAKFLQDDGYIAFQTKAPNSNDNILLLVGPIAPLKMALRIVGTNKDSIIPVTIPANLQEAVKYHGEFQIFRTDRLGNIYICQDAYGFFSLPLHIYKITLQGTFTQVAELPTPADLYTQGSDFFCAEDAIYLTGRQTDYLGLGSTFIKKINYNGLTINDKNYVYNNQSVRPMRLYGISDSIYVTIQNRSLEELKILTLDKNLQEKSVFKVNTPSFDNIVDVDLLPIEKHQFIAAFNTYKRNYPQAQALTDNDVYIKKLDLSSKEIWSYKYPGLGTSLVNECHLRLDAAQNLFVLKTETAGPIFFGVSSPPPGYTLYKYSPNGNLLWKHVLEDSITVNTPNPDHFKIDKAGNALITYFTRDSYFLVKISSSGQSKRVLSGIAVFNLFETNDGRTIITEYAPNGRWYVNIFDANNNLLKRHEANGEVRHIFQLPGSNMVYWLAHDPGVFFYDPKTFYLYAEGNLLWEHPLRIGNERETLISSSFNPDNGTIFYTTTWGDNKKTIHRITINGIEQNTSLQYQGDHHKIFVLGDRLLLVRNEDLQVWNDALDYQATKNIPASYNNHYQIQQNNLFLATDSFFRVFDRDGNLIKQYRNDWISIFSIAAPNVNGTLSFYAAKGFGAYLSGTQQWSRWRLSKFDLDPLMVSVQGGTEDPSNLVRVYPNPAVDQISVEIFGQPSTSSTLDLFIVNALGIVCQQQQLTHAVGPQAVDIGQLPPGLYFCVIKNAQNRFYGTKFNKI